MAVRHERNQKKDKQSGRYESPVMNADNTAVIACGMLRPEIEAVYRRCHITYPVVWQESGLHEFPSQLKESLASNVEKYKDKKYILLVYGMCGYGVMGLQSNATLVMPKFDDCIRILMSREAGKLIPAKKDRIYLTKNWVRSKKFVLREFDRYIRDYGEEQGQMLVNTIISGYTGVDLIDDSAYEVDALQAEVAPHAKKYGLTCEVVPGTLRVLEKLLTGRWDEEMVIVKPGHMVTLDDFSNRAGCDFQ